MRDLESVKARGELIEGVGGEDMNESVLEDRLGVLCDMADLSSFIDSVRLMVAEFSKRILYEATWLAHF